MSRSLMLRLLESFFRRWYLYLVPVVLLAVVGFFSVSGTKNTFVSSGTFNVEGSTVLSNLSGDNTQTFGDSPAGAASRRINSTLQTDQFVKDIAKRAGIDAALSNGTISTNWIRSSLSSSTNGPNLVIVTAVNQDPQVAQRLAQATIDTFVQSLVDGAASQSNAAVEFFSGLLTTYQADVDRTKQALDDYVASHPAPAVGNRPETEQAEVTRLSGDLTQAQATLTATLNKRQEAQLSTEQTKADMGERLRVIDPPLVPAAPQPKLKKMVTSFATFVMLGLVLAAGALVLGTVLNHTVLTASDVNDRLGMRVLAVVPDSAGRRLPKTKVAKQPKTKPAKEPKAPKEPKKDPTLTPTRTAQIKPLKPAVARKPATPAASPATASRRGQSTGSRRISRATGSGGWPS